jgi:thioredoxin 1
MSVINLNKENFDKEVYDSNVTVLIDFWAPWCAPCRMLAPTLDNIAQEANSFLKVCKVNIDDHPDLAEQFSIMSIPTLIVIKNKKVSNRLLGLHSEQEIINMINR